MTRDEQLIKAALEMAATHARAAFDARSTSRKGHHSLLDWTDGYDEATRACAAAIRAIDVDKLLAKVESETPHAWRDALDELRADNERLRAALVEIAHTFTERSDGTMKSCSASFYQEVARAALAQKGGE